ncbi:hypothetical protein ACIKQB_19935, partial [Acinetobacter baumannii]
MCIRDRYKTLTTCLLVTCLGLSGCATSILSTALPNETTEVQTTILKTDQIIVLGQAIKNPVSYTHLTLPTTNLGC